MGASSSINRRHSLPEVPHRRNSTAEPTIPIRNGILRVKKRRVTENSNTHPPSAPKPRYTIVSLLQSSESAHAALMAFLHENKISHQTILRNPFVDVPGSDAYECILDHIASFLESRQYQLWLAERLNISAPLDDNDIVNLFVGTTHFSNAEYTQLLALLIPKIEHMVQYKSIIRCRNGWFRCLIGFIQHLKVGAYITVQDDEDKNIVVYHNKHVEVLMGYSPGDLIGAPCPCFSKQNDTIKDESLQATLKSQLPFSISHTCIKKDGSEMLSVVMSKPLFDTSNNNQFNIIFQVEENSEEIQALCKFLFFMPNTV